MTMANKGERGSPCLRPLLLGKSPWREIDNNGKFDEGSNAGPYPFDLLLGEAHSQHGSFQESPVNTVERFPQVNFHTHPANLKML